MLKRKSFSALGVNLLFVLLVGISSVFHLQKQESSLFSDLFLKDKLSNRAIGLRGVETQVDFAVLATCSVGKE